MTPQEEIERLREALRTIAKDSERHAYASDHIACHNCRDTAEYAKKVLGEGRVGYDTNAILRE